MPPKVHLVSRVTSLITVQATAAESLSLRQCLLLLSSLKGPFNLSHEWTPEKEKKKQPFFRGFRVSCVRHSDRLWQTHTL